MADTLTLTLFSAATSAASGVMGLAAGQQSAAAAEFNAGYSASVSRMRAAVAGHNAIAAERDAAAAEQNAADASLAGQEDLRYQGYQDRADMGDAVLAEASSGVIGNGRVMQTLRQIAKRNQQARAVQTLNAVGEQRSRADAFRQEAADLKTGAKSARADAEVQKISGQVEASSARMGGVADFVRGIGGTASILLDGSQSPTVRNGLSKIWRRK